VALYFHSPNTPSWRGAQLKHRDNFTFTFSFIYTYSFVLVHFTEYYADQIKEDELGGRAARMGQMRMYATF
jgi:hypothetical protein